MSSLDIQTTNANDLIRQGATLKLNVKVGAVTFTPMDLRIPFANWKVASQLDAEFQKQQPNDRPIMRLQCQACRDFYRAAEMCFERALDEQEYVVCRCCASIQGEDCYVCPRCFDITSIASVPNQSLFFKGKKLCALCLPST